MKKLDFSLKGKKLIKLYSDIVFKGYNTIDESFINDFKLRAYRDDIWPVFFGHSVSSVLDYGFGGSNWTIKGFRKASGFKEYFAIEWQDSDSFLID